MVQANLSLQEQAYQFIRRELLAGRWADGDFLVPSKVAKEVGISYTPVREAIIQLVAEGVLQQTPKAGVCVRSLSRGELQELFEMREIIEGGAVRLAARRMTDERLGQLKTVCDEHAAVLRKLHQSRNRKMAESLVARVRQLDIAFHMNLMASTQNKKLMKTMSDLHLVSSVFMRRLDLMAGDLLKHFIDVYAFHRRILCAIRKQDVAAAEMWMTRHISWAREYHIALCDKEIDNNDLMMGF